MLDIIFPEGNAPELEAQAKKMGWNGVVRAIPYSDKKAIAEAKGSLFAPICTQSTVNSAASYKLVILSPPEDILGPLKQGRAHAILNIEKERITQVHCKLAAESGIAFVITLASILKRPKTLDFWHRYAKLINKYKVPLLICTGASAMEHIRSPHDLAGLMRSIGINEKLVNEGLARAERLLS